MCGVDSSGIERCVIDNYIVYSPCYKRHSGGLSGNRVELFDCFCFEGSVTCSNSTMANVVVVNCCQCHIVVFHVGLRYGQWGNN